MIRGIDSFAQLSFEAFTPILSFRTGNVGAYILYKIFDYFHFGLQNTECRMQNAECRMQNAHMHFGLLIAENIILVLKEKSKREKVRERENIARGTTDLNWLQIRSPDGAT